MMQFPQRMEFPIEIGTDLDTGKRFLLNPDSFSTHYQFVGATGTGKTTAMETILQGLITNNVDSQSIFVIDPFGNFIQRLLRFIASEHFCHQSVRDRLIYIEPANIEYTTTLNPLRYSSRPNQDFQVARAMDLLLRGFETQELAGMPRLRRFLHQGLFDISQLDMPLSFIKYLLTPGMQEHNELMARLPDESQAIWKNVVETHGRNATDYLDSTHNRVALFNDHVVLKRMFSSSDNLLDIPRFMTEGRIVLINLSLGDSELHWQASSTIGSMIINEIMNHGITLTNANQKPNNTYVVLDEFQRFLGPDIFDFLPVVRQMGIHLMLAHQSFSQLVKGDIDLRPMIAQARSRMMFANDFEDADIIAEELTNMRWDPMKVKNQIQSMRQRIVGHRKEILHGGGTSHSDTVTDTHQTKRGTSQGETRPPSQSPPTTSKGDQYSWADVTGGSTANAENQTWSESLVPIYKTFYETSSIQYESREEFLHKIRKDLTGLGKGNAFFKQVEDPNLYRLGIRYLPPGDDQRTLNAVEELKQKNFEEGPFISSAKADKLYADLREELRHEPIQRIISENPVDMEAEQRHKDAFDD